ncbi:hypothetical protein CL621_01250 [archaeon]|nr:hypothetical protein [archaeon]|tara:strand:+ start:2679 stop:3008 length:330 start_codon:yes stop_codon:yes gene_type:complete
MNKEDKVLLVFRYSQLRNNFRDHLREQGYSKIWGYGDPLRAIADSRSYQPDLVFVGDEYLTSINIAGSIKHRTVKNTVIKIIDTKDSFKKIKKLEDLIFKDMIETAENR